MFTCVYIGKIFKNENNEPKMFKLTWKLPDIVQIQVCSNHGPQGSIGATIGETIFTCVYIGKIFKNLLLKNH
jgi:hypothetical protein